jgi:hypothetical protein
MSFYKETHNELYKFVNDIDYVFYSLPNTLSISFNKLYTFLSKLDPIRLQIFIETNLYTLQKVSHEILLMIRMSKNKVVYHNGDPNVLRSMYDKLFINMLNIKNHPKTSSTYLFRDFIKGITYFKYQEKGILKHPVYHRLFSCGDGSNAFRNTFNRCNIKNKSTVYKRIKTCYLERLIYGNIYLKNVFLQTPSWDYTKKIQDKPHIDWLEQTLNDFNTCFPGISVKIKIKYNQNYPIYLMVLWIFKNKIKYIEEYIKYFKVNQQGEIDYKDIVNCIKRNKDTTTVIKRNFSDVISITKKKEDNKKLFSLLEHNKEIHKDPYKKILSSFYSELI